MTDTRPIRWRLYEPLPEDPKTPSGYPDGAPVGCIRLARCQDGRIALLGWGRDAEVCWVLAAEDARTLLEQLTEALR